MSLLRLRHGLLLGLAPVVEPRQLGAHARHGASYDSATRLTGSRRSGKTTLRHCFANDQINAGRDPRTGLYHRDVGTTMIYTHVLNRGGRCVLSPADRL